MNNNPNNPTDIHPEKIRNDIIKRTLEEMDKELKELCGDKS